MCVVSSDISSTPLDSRARNGIVSALGLGGQRKKSRHRLAYRLVAIMVIVNDFLCIGLQFSGTVTRFGLLQVVFRCMIFG